MLKYGLLGLLASTAAMAADLPASAPPPPPPPVPEPIYRFVGWEARAGAFAHDPLSPEGGSADFNGELILPKFYTTADPYWNLAIPRVNVGVTANFVGKTSNAYAGLVWTLDLPYQLFIEGQLGGAVNNGKTGFTVPQGHNKIGCNESFHESASGGYRLTEAWSIMGTIEHFSNAGLCVQNRGVTNYGLRVGYRF